MISRLPTWPWSKMMQRCLISRLFSSAASSPLAVLRKKTGFPIGKCKEALTKHNDDLEAAESWLHSQAKKEGWAKLEKLHGRTAQQGLIGVIAKERQATMTEVNCETDFVARNTTFQELASTVTTTLHSRTPTLQDSLEHFNKDTLGGLKTGDKNLSDLLAESVGHLGENIVLNRGCTLSVSSGRIYGYAYNNVCPVDSELSLGIYGALVHLVPANGGKMSDSNEISTLGRKLCQQIIAMNPSVVESEGEGEVEEPSQVLVNQEFMFDVSLTVGELLRTSGVRVANFVRYALGETS